MSSIWAVVHIATDYEKEVITQIILSNTKEEDKEGLILDYIYPSASSYDESHILNAVYYITVTGSQYNIGSNADEYVLFIHSFVDIDGGEG